VGKKERNTHREIGEIEIKGGRHRKIREDRKRSGSERGGQKEIRSERGEHREIERGRRSV
jgi:hypothetical protein